MGSWSRQLHVGLLDARLPTSSHRHIILDDRVRHIITLDKVKGLLADELHVEHILVERLASTVLSHATTILAILVCIGRTSSLLDSFIYPCIWDTRLPLGSSDLPASLAVQFVAEQYHFLAPVFTPRLFADWRAETILPFFLDEQIPSADGGFSTLHKIGIIPELQHIVSMDQDPKLIYFARKELKERRSKESSRLFQREKQTLEKLNLLRHPNIVPLLASYIHDDKFNMIFPLADADLAAWLDGRLSLSIDDDGIWRQMLGITSALAALHHFRYQTDDMVLENVGYHHDLKPQNILVKDNTFLLADFGLARLKATSEDSATVNKHGTATYGAPELHAQASRLQHSRALDTWSWACIILEIATFMQLGSHGVKEFRAHRMTESPGKIDYYFHNMVGLKAEVKEWIDLLRKTAASRGYGRIGLFNETLSISDTMLAFDAASRPPMSSVYQSLRALCEREKILEATENDSIPTTQGEESREPVSTPQTSMNRMTTAGNILENLADLLDGEHPVIQAVRREANSGSMREET